MKYLFFVFIILFSCQKDNNSLVKISQTTNVKDIHLTNSFKKESLADYVKDIDMIFLRTDYNLMGISKVIFYENKYYVFDKKTSLLLVFNNQGYFIKKIGKRGGGPGEFKKITDFEIDKENKLILVLSEYDRSVYVYNINGDFIKRIRLNFFIRGFTLSNDGTFFFMTGRSSDVRRTLVRTNSDGKIIESYFPFPKDVPVKSIGFSGGLHKQGVTNFFTEQTSSVIYKVDDSIYPLYKFNFGDDTWKDEDKFKIDLFIKKIYKFEVSLLHNYYCDTDSVLAFQFQKNRYLRRGYFFKKSDKVIAVPFNLKDDYIYNLIRLPVGVQDNKFISYVDIETCQNIFSKKETKLSLEQNFPFLHETLNHFKIDDNPFLIIYELKDHS